MTYSRKGTPWSAAAARTCRMNAASSGSTSMLRRCFRSATPQLYMAVRYHSCYNTGMPAYKPRPRGSLAERLWSKIRKTDTCWEWTGSIDGGGYGHLYSGVGGKGGTLLKAHRVVWELTYGSIPDGLWVLHKCDNRACVRPDHLFLGTHADNMADMKAKGRGVTGDRNGTHTHPERCRGEAKGSSRLTADQVREIRVIGSAISLKKLASRYGVGQTAIWDILHGVTWRHMLDELQEGVTNAAG
jgi:hypothetical protein